MTMTMKRHQTSSTIFDMTTSGGYVIRHPFVFSLTIQSCEFFLSLFCFENKSKDGDVRRQSGKRIHS